MRFSAIVSAAFLACTALAVPATNDKLGVTTILSAFKDVTAALDDLDKSVKALNPAINVQRATEELTLKSDKVLSVLKTQTEAINKDNAPVGLLEATQLLTPSNTLAARADEVVNDLISKKPVIDNAKQTKTVLKQLTEQRAATQGFSDAVLKQVPAAARGIAQSAAKKATDALDKGVKAFS